MSGVCFSLSYHKLHIISMFEPKYCSCNKGLNVSRKRNARCVTFFQELTLFDRRNPWLKWSNYLNIWILALYDERLTGPKENIAKYWSWSRNKAAQLIRGHNVFWEVRKREANWFFFFPFTKNCCRISSISLTKLSAFLFLLSFLCCKNFLASFSLKRLDKQNFSDVCLHKVWWVCVSVSVCVCERERERTCELVTFAIKYYGKFPTFKNLKFS